MQNTNKVQQGQSFLDMVFQQTGSFEQALNMAILQGISITDDLQIGESLKITAVTDPDMVNVLQKRNPATALRTVSGDSEKLEGIGYWIINYDFKVS